ncbi:CGNR zinc finger domain-containing protein [Calditrichota bacterium]
MSELFETTNSNRELKLKTGWLCLDYANTADWHASDKPVEGISDFRALITWSQNVGVLSEEESAGLEDKANRNAELANSVYTEAIELREAIYHLFSDLAEGRDCDETDLKTINQTVAKAMQNFRLVKGDACCTWECRYDSNVLDSMLLPIAHSASVLLTSELVSRVGKCADDRGCGWLFLDTSRNRSRRWCDMRDCGNRNKVKRYYSRKQLPSQPHTMTENYVRSRQFIPGMREMIDTGQSGSPHPWVLP